MKLKSLTTIAAIVAVAGAALTAQPAAAATTLTFDITQAQFDDNPGNGAESWIWFWMGTPTATSRFAELDYEYYDGSIGVLTGEPNTGVSENLPKDVWRIRSCVLDDLKGFPSCSNWAY